MLAFAPLLPVRTQRATSPGQGFHRRVLGSFPTRQPPVIEVYSMSLDKATVARIATLARIKVPEADREALGHELNQILHWVEQLAEVDTTGVEPMTSVAAITLPMRRDLVTDGDRPDDILKNAPAAAHGFFTVPKVVE
jgi:aspartyl-tRNA(Asn)/glutamyl-tRNA(Gln) amidotransferase subunit C